MRGPLDRVVYRPFDRLEKLGEPPWLPDDPKLIAWEAAHGHDARLKCYPEFGCQVIQERADRIEHAARVLLDAWSEGALTSRMFDPIERLREALDG